MKTIIITYLPGHAGNFLARLFSFGHETMPQLPRTLLNKYISIDSKNENLDRLTMYSFKETDSYRTWQEFHRAWSDFYQQSTYNLLAAIWKKSNIVYAIHPIEFSKFEIFMTGDPNIKFFYVHLDPKDQTWVDSSRKKLLFVDRDCEYDKFDSLKSKYNMEPINLSAMLESEEEFLKEYTRCCSLMGLNVYPELAIEMYRDWARVRL